MSTLLDSDVLIYFFNEYEPCRSFVNALLEQEKLHISIISVMEICAGWNEEQRDKFLPKLYKLFTVEPVTQAIAERAGILRHEQKAQQKRKPRPMDALIAATAIEHKHRLVTNNRHDFNIDGLELYRELWRD